MVTIVEQDTVQNANLTLKLAQMCSMFLIPTLDIYRSI